MQARSDQARALGHDERVISIDAMIADYQDTLEKVDKIIDFASQLAAAGYAPLMRFGKYAVTVQERDPMTGELVRDADGASTPLFFGRYDTQAEAKDAYFNQGARYAGMSDSVSITTGVVNDDEHQMYAGATPEVIGLFANMVGGKTVEQMAYKKAVSDQSALKRRISRKNVAGYSREYDRVLSNFVMSSGRWASWRPLRLRWPSSSAHCFNSCSRLSTESRHFCASCRSGFSSRSSLKILSSSLKRCLALPMSSTFTAPALEVSS